MLLYYSCSTNSSSQAVYPTLPAISRPVPEPAPPGERFLPPVSGVAAANTPTFAEWTHTAGPDESIVATGVNFSRYTGMQEGKDTRYLIYAGGELSKKVNLRRVDDNKAIITLDKSISNWSMYLIWPGNEAGYGTPVAINQTDAWWLGPDKVKPGTTTSVYGRNLAHNNGTTSSNVYIKPANGAGQWARVTKVNPYKVEFLVPANLPIGNYEVWVHNGHGGTYGWSGPLTLLVQHDSQWNSEVFNVKDYGAAGNGNKDDTQAILNAIAAATTNSSVYFPAGVYKIKAPLRPKDKSRWIGDGRNKSIIRLAANFDDPGDRGFISGYEVSDVEIKEMAFDANHEYAGPNEHATLMFFRLSHNVVFDNIRFSMQGYNPFDLHDAWYTTIKNCEIIGKTCFLGTSHQTFIDSCTFRQTNDSHMAIHSWGGVGISLTNSTCSDYDNSNPDDGAGWGQGRFFVGLGLWGSSRWTYIGNNTTRDLTVRPGVKDQNTGEQFMWEGNQTIYSGTPSSSSSTTVTLGGYVAPDSASRYAVIVKGRGFGQSRRIISNHGATITLEKAWSVVPDSSSIINVGSYVDRVVIYNNSLDGKARANGEAYTASIGIEPFGGNMNYIIDNNTLNQLRLGTSNWALREKTFPGLSPNFFMLYTNNKYLNCRWAISNVFEDYNGTSLKGTGILGTIYRRNAVQNTLVGGITNSLRSTSASPVLEGLVYEHNTMLNVPHVYEFSNGTTNVGNQLLYNNVFNQGSSPSQTPAIQVLPKMAFQKNVFTGFSTIYSKVPGDGVATEANGY